MPRLTSATPAGEGFSVVPLTPAIGAEVLACDLQTLTAAQHESLAALLWRYLVVVIREQHLSPETQIAFTSRFGEPEIHPLATHRDVQYPHLLVLRNNPSKPGRRNDVWHTDVTFAERPPSIGVLHALEVTPARGDTLFSSLRAAYETLSPGMQRLLGGLRAIHRADREVLTRTPGVTEKNLAEHLPVGVSHPVVRRHPVSATPSLFLNPYYVRHFESFSPDESRPLTDFLVAHTTRPENIYRHRWRQGDVVLFDNQTTMHYAVHDYDPTMPRLMHRTTVAGSAPEQWRAL